MNFFLLFTLLPFFAKTQEVAPVISNDYLKLIRTSGTSLSNGLHDSANSLRNATLQIAKLYNGNRIGRIKIKGNQIFMKPALAKSLFWAGSFNSTIELKAATRLPSTQTTYVQGRSQGGSLLWRGPETDELFSYGPAAKMLEFDGSLYAFDARGRLVQMGTGNGQPTAVYQSNIFRTGASLSQSFHLQGRYLVSGRQVLMGDLQLGQKQETIFIKSNRNTSQNIKASAEGTIQWLTISGSYNHATDGFTNDNRNGFLNRVYQNALLTPISFDNKPETRLGSGQRAYSHLADNPFFLLKESNNSLQQTAQTASFSIEKKTDAFKFKITQSVENNTENESQAYAPGTAFFTDGIAVNRVGTDKNYFLKGTASYNFPQDDYIASRLVANYILSNNHTLINYTPGAIYNLQRSSQDASLSYIGSYRKSYVDVGLHLTDKIYVSNTASPNNFFLPAIACYVRKDRFFGVDYLVAKLTGSFTAFDAEQPIENSFSQSNLLRYSTDQAFQYFPVTEAFGFDGLAPVRHKEYSARLEMTYRNRYSFSAETFRRLVSNDVFPVVENGLLQLKNIADHRNTGIELEAEINTFSRKVQTTHTVSFFSNRSKVTSVKDGFNFTPIAGFSNVNKALVIGQEAGVIVGSRWLRDGADNIVIGNDGFPLVDATKGVIGHPLPTFVIKASNSISYKNFSVNIDGEWRKGGDVWNGTQAALDYYGRSQTSALLRNTTNYVFTGVLQDGHPNTIPVSFYDPSLPLEKARWVRYGQSGVAEDYIQKSDNIRLHNLSISYKIFSRKYIQIIALSLYANNIIIWTAYKGADPSRLLYDEANSSGLDFFNLPSTKNFGCNISLQF